MGKAGVAHLHKTEFGPLGKEILETERLERLIEEIAFCI